MDEKEVRYDFGRNWSEYSSVITSEEIGSAVDGVTSLFPDVHKKEVLDIGCGSGIHTLAFLTLGAAKVTCIDYDQDSVNTAERVLNTFYSGNNYQVFRGDILNKDGHWFSEGKQYDIVYSWGVLHHTGDMWKAIDNVSEFTKVGGKFSIALYIKTPLCKFWKIEKRYYSRYKPLRSIIKIPFSIALILGYMLLKKKPPSEILNDHSTKRGMSFFHDIDDWLGGYPYESVDEQELLRFMENRNFKLVRKKILNQALDYLVPVVGSGFLLKLNSFFNNK